MPPSLKQKAVRDRASFDVKVHGIKKRKPTYWFRCVVPGCKQSFPSIKFWNSHHGIEHTNYKLICHTCNKQFCTPSAKRVHSNAHATTKYQCPRCDKLFPYASALKQHKHIHAATSLHKCFAGGCNKAYKWPQDLNRHIKVHTHPTTFSCDSCDKKFNEERLLKHHARKHLDEFKYFYTHRHTHFIHAGILTLYWQAFPMPTIRHSRHKLSGILTVINL